MIVSREDLEASLRRVEARSGDPRSGIHGPGSHAWALKRESINFIGGGRAAFLQLAHPYVAYAIDQHSKTRDDIQGRFQRTFLNVFEMTFGDLTQAFTAARKVHTVHTYITGEISDDVGPFRRGHAYNANESSALLWVWATLADTIIRCHELVIGRLTDDYKEQFYQQAQSFAMLFGIPEDELPGDYLAFDAYVRGMIDSDVLTVSKPALRMSEFLLAPPRPALAPVMTWYRRMTAGLLPPRLRDDYRFRWTVADRALFKASVQLIKPIYRATPRALRYIPAYVEARRRLEGKAPSRVSALMERMAMAGLGS